MPQPNRIPDFVREMGRAVRAAEIAGAERIAEAAKEKVPVDPNAQTHLRDAIHTEETEDGVAVVAGDNKHWYGHMVEHGTVHSAPHPFLIPALEENRDLIVREIEQALRRSAG